MGAMKCLYLLRHAKSSWKDRGLDDHERPLARRGRRAAKVVVRYVGERGIEPELVLCSTARRACETLERIQPALGTPAVQIEPGLYQASARALLERLRSVSDEVGSVMLIGHNPGVQELALDLARPAPGTRRLELKYPTAGLATLTFRGPAWRTLEPGSAELVDFLAPRDLAP
jgi:phosphohistidine phosphatase